MGAISCTDADTSKVKTNNKACMFFFSYQRQARNLRNGRKQDVPQLQKAEETSYIASIMQIEMKE